LVFNSTPFYPEGGGQVGDTGFIDDGTEKISIFNTNKENNLIIHTAKKLPKNIEQEFNAVVSQSKRRLTAKNHTATHLLHKALRDILGTHVEQKGSLVNSDYLRFDFSHFQKMSKEEIRAVERIANRKIRENIALNEMRETPIGEAQAMGAMALFGEKYGETVRVIQFGTSTELCGGTHVHSTGEIGMVRIVSESSIAAGIRRIEAITGEAVELLMDAHQDILSEAKELLNNVPDILNAIKKQAEENSELKKQIDTINHEKIMQLRDELLQKAVEVNGVKTIRFEGTLTADQAKTLAFQIRNIQETNLFFVAGCVHDGKPSLTVLLSDDLVAKGMNAVNIAREAAKEIQGGGGGQPFFASAGGKNPAGIKQAIAKVLSLVG